MASFDWCLPQDCRVWTPSGRKYKPEPLKMLGALFAKGESLVLSTRGVLAGVDPQTFELLAHGRYDEEFGAYDWAYAGNAQAMYFASSLSAPHKIATRHRASFRYLGELHACDEQRVYWEGRVLDHAEPATFRVLDRTAGVDANHAWYRNHLIDGADPASLRVVPPTLDNTLPLYADRNQAYVLQHSIPDSVGIRFERNAEGACDGRRSWNKHELYAAIPPQNKRDLVFSDASCSVELHDGIFLAQHATQLGQFLLLCLEGSVPAYEKLSRGRIGESSVVRAIKRLNEVSPEPLAEISRDRILITPAGAALFRRHRDGIALVRRTLDIPAILRELLG